jgi:hypothetical protein
MSNDIISSYEFPADLSPEQVLLSLRFDLMTPASTIVTALEMLAASSNSKFDDELIATAKFYSHRIKGAVNTIDKYLVDRQDAIENEP